MGAIPTTKAHSQPVGIIDVVNSFQSIPTLYNVYELVSVPSLALAQALPRHMTGQLSWAQSYM